MIQIAIEGVATRAVVDTGGVYLIDDPSIANELGLDPQAAIGTDIVSIRRENFKGRLHRIVLHLPSDEGESLDQEVTAFIPDANPEQWGELPTYLGLTGCLEFLRFALDPLTMQFYFASA